MTFAVILPYLIAGGVGFLVRHFDLFGKLLGAAAGPNPLASPGGSAPPPLPSVRLGNHPVLSDAVNAAIKAAVNDAVNGHLESVKAEITNAALAAVNAAVADLKGKSAG